MISAEEQKKVADLVKQTKDLILKEMDAVSYTHLFFKGPEELFDFCLRKRILIRDCSNYPGLKKGYYRVAVKRHEENIRPVSYTHLP